MGKTTATASKPPKPRERDAAHWLRDTGQRAADAFAQELALWLARAVALLLFVLMCSATGGQFSGFAALIAWALSLLK